MAGMNYGSGKRGAIMAKHVRSQGVVDGESDLLFAVPKGEFGSLVLEHKAETSKHPISDDQMAYNHYHNEIGNCGIITKGIDAAKTAISIYMALKDTE
jgi:hypothetical protein